MAKNSRHRLNLGDYVRILHSSFPKARIVELRGPLGPGGMQIYRVRVGSSKNRKPTFIELREDQLQALSPADGEAASRSK